MDNALIADSVIVLILIVGALAGAKRGLVKSLMGVLVIAGALAGALALANLLTDPIADALAARVEDKMARRFSDALEMSVSEVPHQENGGLEGLFEQYGLPKQLLDELLDAAGGAMDGAADAVREKLTEQFRGAVSAGVHAAVRGTVRTVLMLVCFLALTVVLKLLANALDCVFDLPPLNLVNSVGGAAMGLLEAGAVIYALLFFASCFGLTAVTDCADRSRLIFLFRRSFGILPSLPA